MKNSKRIATAIQAAASVLGSNAELARRVGLHKSTIGTYVNGIVDDIRDEHWNRLWPYIRPYLPESLEFLPRKELHVADTHGSYVSTEDRCLDECPPILRAAVKAWPLLTTDTRNTILGVLRFAEPEITAKLAAGKEGDAK